MKFSPSVWKRGVILAIILVFTIFFLRPALLGYAVYKDAQNTQLQPEEYGKTLTEVQRDLDQTQNNLSSSIQIQEHLQEELQSQTDEVHKLTLAKARLEMDLQKNKDAATEKKASLEEDIRKLTDDYSSRLQQLQQQLSDLDSQYHHESLKQQAALTQLQGNYSLLIQSTARSICCKEKVDDNLITAYVVSDGHIFCTTEGERLPACFS